jgi:hypothetical protein
LSCGGYERALDYVHFDGKSNRISNQPEKLENISIRQKQAQNIPAERSERNRAGALKQRDAPHKKSIIKKEPSEGILGPWIDKSLGVAQYQTGFLFVIQERYLPDMGVVSSDLGQGFCESWIGEACALSFLPGSEKLHASLLSVSLALLGKEGENKDLSFSAVQHYSRALNGLCAGFSSGPFATLDQHQVDVSLITCLWCSMYEVGSSCILCNSLADVSQLLVNQNFLRQFQHLQGMCF